MTGAGKTETAGGVNRAHGRSLPAKLTFAALHALSLAICAWLVFGAGWDMPDRTRAGLLLGAAALYFARHMLTLFVLLKRKVGHGEALGLSAFLAAVEIGFVLVGGGMFRAVAVPLGALDVLAGAMILAGSWLNTASELGRHAWKKHPENKGKCYTGGLFGWSMHINYFGDTMMFTGWALLTRAPLMLLLPLVMAASFVFYHIPALDAYLAKRYGADFRTFAARTWRFAPFIW